MNLKKVYCRCELVKKYFTKYHMIHNSLYMTIYISAIMASSSSAPHGPANMSSDNSDSEVDVNHVMES